MTFAALLAASLAPGVTDAHAETMSLEHWLLPDALADRIEGSGLSCRSMRAPGEDHRVELASVKVRLSERLRIRAGLGMARLAIGQGDSELVFAGTALAGGATFSLGEGHGFRIQVDASAMGVAYQDSTMVDASIIVALVTTR